MQPEKIKRIENKSLLLLKIRRIEKSLLLLKIRRMEKSLCLPKIRQILEILAFTENQADFRNPCVHRKSGGFKKSLHLQKIRRTIESLRALKSPRLVKKTLRLKKNPHLKKNQWDWKSRRPAYCLGSAESLAADFFLVLLMSSRSDPRRCAESRMQSPSEETAQAALLLWAALSRTVPAHHAKKWLKSTGQPKVRRLLGILLIPVKSQNSELGL